MASVNPVPHESNTMRNLHDTREAAINRIHAEEMDRIEAILTAYELDKANAKFLVRDLCAKFGANHIAAWVIESAESLGQSL